jgi:hypothetical protein
VGLRLDEMLLASLEMRNAAEGALARQIKNTRRERDKKKGVAAAI